jgi:hypothetical protein
VVLFWHLLASEQDYAFGRPTLTRKKLRRLELAAGAPRGKGQPGIWAADKALRQAELELALQAETAYRRLVTDWQPRKGAGATPGRASQGRHSGKQRGKASIPDPALARRRPRHWNCCKERPTSPAELDSHPSREAEAPPRECRPGGVATTRLDCVPLHYWN